MDIKTSDLAILSRNLKLDDFDKVRRLWELLSREGYGAIRTAAIIYRIGYEESKAVYKAKIKELHKRIHANESTADTRPDEGAEDAQKGDLNNEQ